MLVYVTKLQKKCGWENYSGRIRITSETEKKVGRIKHYNIARYWHLLNTKSRL